MFNDIKDINEQSSELSQKTKTQSAIQEECRRISSMLIEKNRSYGDSALDPIRIFSRSNSVEQIKVRIDDKLSRINRGSEFIGEDTLDDLIGYLVLLSIAQKETWK